MPQYIDSYYLVDSRKAKLVDDFLKNYLFVKNELAENYPIPQYSENPIKIFYSDIDLLSYLEEDFNCDYLIYWENGHENSEIKQFTLQYTDDGKMIFGVSIIGNELHTKEGIKLFKDIKSYLNSKEACITIEEPPPTNSFEFIDFCNERYKPI